MTGPACIRCDDTGVKDLWGFAMDPCDNPECRAAIADTHPKDGDVKQAPLVSGGGAEGNRPNTVRQQREGKR